MTIVKTFVARPGSHLSNADAQRVGQFLDEAFGEDVFTANDIVEYARPKESPLHEDFTWDKDKAAEKWNLQEARMLVAAVMVVEAGKTKKEATRAFHHIVEVTEEGTKSGYTPDHVVWQREDFAEQVIEKAKRELIAWQRRYGSNEDLREWALEQLGT